MLLNSGDMDLKDFQVTEGFSSDNVIRYVEKDSITPLKKSIIKEIGTLCRSESLAKC